MTRFALLQSRTQTLVVTATLAALAIAAAITGVHLSHLYHELVSPCRSSGTCQSAIPQFADHYNFLQNALQFLLRIAPALIGIFWGGPLIARELETGAYRLAWTQTVTRTRWVVTKLAIVGGTAIVIAGLLTLMITWWFRALDGLDNNMYAVFDARDVVPIGYTFFAFTAGALLGAVLRRTLPAMAATLGLFAFVRIAVQLWVRPHLLSPLHTSTSLLRASGFGISKGNGPALALFVQGSSPPGSWELSSRLVTSSGHVVSAGESAAFVQQHCHIPPPPGTGTPSRGSAPDDVRAAFQACQAAAAKSFHVVVGYQPANRYWTFQWLELAIYVVLGLVAAALCVWWVTRRIR